ncbi:MAG: Ig-like domain-containing protein [Anaerolineaceae bacterium]|nr:Ig-like domain-containing protein [Anaerolineaceae bacterium]
MNQCKFSTYLIVFLLLALLLPAAAYAQVPIQTMTIQREGVDVNRRNLYLDFNQSVTFDIVTTPEIYFSRTDILVKSSNDNIAAAEYDGSGSFIVKTKNISGNVTVTVQDNISKKAAYVRLFVQKMVDRIDVYQEGEHEVSAGQNFRIYAEPQPNDATDKRLLWYAYESPCDKTNLSSCKPTTAASVTSGGFVSGRQVDKDTSVDIVICPADAGTNGSEKCEIYEVTVKPVLRGLVIRDKDSNDVTSKTVYMDINDSQFLTVEADPQSITLDAEKITYKSSNMAIIEADGRGVNIPVFSKDKSGSITITVRDERSRKSASVRITVKTLSSQVVLALDNPDKVDSGKSITLNAAVEPKEADQNLLWEVCAYSADPDTCEPTNAATITRSGKNAVLTARTVDEETKVVVRACPADGRAFCVKTREITIMPVARDILVKDEEGHAITNADVINIVAGTPYQLSAEPVPSSVTDTYRWESSNRSVATVDQNGNITGIMRGSATITVFSNTARIRRTIKIRVIGKLATGIELKPDAVDYDLVDGKSITFTATVLPYDADVRTVKWSVECVEKDKCLNGVPATVVNGRVTATHVNLRTKIKVCAETMDKSKKECVEITVAPKAKALYIVDKERLVTIPIAGDEFHFHSPNLTDAQAPIIKMLNSTDKYVQLAALLDTGEGVEPREYYETKNVYWDSFPKSVAIVDQTGMVTFIQPGTVTITARTTDGSNLSRTATVTGQYQVMKIKITSSTGSTTGTDVLGAGRSLQLFATPIPQTATNPRIRWYIHPERSTSLHAAVVNEVTGVVTAAEVTREEHVTIVAEATDVDRRNQPLAQAYHEIIITPLAGGLDIYYNNQIVSGTTVYADINDGWLKFSAVVNPFGVTQEVVWSSSNPRVASVDPNTGVVTIFNPGSTTIQAVAKDGSGAGAVFTLQVGQKAKQIEIVLEPSSRFEEREGYEGIKFYRFRAGTTVTLQAKMDNNFVTNRNAKWYVKDLDGIPSINFRYNAALGYALGPSFTFSTLDVSNKACSLITAVADDASGSYELGTVAPDLVDQIGICVFPSVKATKIYRFTGGYNENSQHAGIDITSQTFYMNLGDTLVVGIDSDYDQKIDNNIQAGDIFARNYPDDAYQGTWAWQSTNSAILKFNGRDTFQAMHAGTVDVIAKSLDGTNQMAGIRINVIDFSKLSEQQRAALFMYGELYIGRSRSYYAAASGSNADGASALAEDAHTDSENAVFAVSGPETAAPGESLKLIADGVTEGYNVYWFSSDQSIASVDGTGTVSIAENAAVDSVVAITAAMDDANTTFAMHEIKVTAIGTGSDTVNGTDSIEEKTAEAIENGDIDSLVTLLLSDNSDESTSEENGETANVVSDENQPVNDDQNETEVNAGQQDTEELIDVVQTETPEPEQQFAVTVQPVVNDETVTAPEITDVYVYNELQEQPGTVEENHDGEPVSNEIPAQTDVTAPMVQMIFVDVNGDVIITTVGQTFTLETAKMQIYPFDADWNTLAFAIENEYVAELESGEWARIQNEGLKVKGLNVGETILTIKSGIVEKKLRIVVLPEPVVVTTPDPAEVLETYLQMINGNAVNDGVNNTGQGYDALTTGVNGFAEVSEPAVEQTNTEQIVEEQVTVDPEAASTGE